MLFNAEDCAPPDPGRMKDVCIFSHFDPDGTVDTHVVRYLRALADCGFTIIVVSTAQLDAAARSSLLHVAAEVIVRDNIGYDFGSWAVALARYRSQIHGRLLLANDSVYGPIGSLNAAIQQLTRTRHDFYGMVQSAERAPHLQSWFLLFEPNVVRSRAFAEIFCQPLVDRTKEQIIRDLELAATTALVRHGFTYRALYMAEGRRLASNPMLYLWREIIEKYGIPFLKIGVLRDDPLGVFRHQQWRHVVDGRAPELAPLISNHQARLRRAQAHDGRMTRVMRRIFMYFVFWDDYLARKNLPVLGAVGAAVFRIAFDAARYGLAGWRRLSQYLNLPAKTK
jgi:hypothetical protein